MSHHHSNLLSLISLAKGQGLLGLSAGFPGPELPPLHTAEMWHPQSCRSPWVSLQHCLDLQSGFKGPSSQMTKAELYPFFELPKLYPVPHHNHALQPAWESFKVLVFPLCFFLTSLKDEKEALGRRRDRGFWYCCQR